MGLFVNSLCRSDAKGRRFEKGISSSFFELVTHCYEALAGASEPSRAGAARKDPQEGRRGRRQKAGAARRREQR